MPRAASRHLLPAIYCGAALLAAPIACGAATGADVFSAHCAVCHGPKAEGIPGSFPPLGNQIKAFAASPAGREYLVAAVSAGLIGTVAIAGATFQGAMPPQNMLSEAEVAAVLNYLASGLGKSKAGARAFDAAEVTAVRTRRAGITAPGALALRPAVPD